MSISKIARGLSARLYSASRDDQLSGVLNSLPWGIGFRVIVVSISGYNTVGDRRNGALSHLSIIWLLGNPGAGRCQFNEI